MKQILILCTDGLSDLLEGVPVREQAQRYVDALVSSESGCVEFDIDTNLALRVLKRLLEGENDDGTTLSQMITVQSERPWLDDITLVVQTL